MMFVEIWDDGDEDFALVLPLSANKTDWPMGSCDDPLLRSQVFVHLPLFARSVLPLTEGWEEPKSLLLEGACPTFYHALVTAVRTYYPRATNADIVIDLSIAHFIKNQNVKYF